MMNKIEAVIFDLDGTLVDSMGYWNNVDKEYLSRRNIEIPERLFTDIEEGNSFLEVAQYFKEKFLLADSVEDIIREWIGIVGKHYEADIIIKDGVLNLLEILHNRGIKLAVGTSNSVHLAEAVLKANGVIGFFDTIVTGCTGLRGKPYPDIFLAAAAKINVKPESCIVCEDTLIGIRAAKRAGMTAIAVADIHSASDKESIKNESDFYGEDYGQITNYILKKC